MMCHLKHKIGLTPFWFLGPVMWAVMWKVCYTRIKIGSQWMVLLLYYEYNLTKSDVNKTRCEEMCNIWRICERKMGFVTGARKSASSFVSYWSLLTQGTKSSILENYYLRSIKENLLPASCFFTCLFPCFLSSWSLSPSSVLYRVEKEWKRSIATIYWVSVDTLYRSGIRSSKKIHWSWKKECYLV